MRPVPTLYITPIDKIPIGKEPSDRSASFQSIKNMNMYTTTGTATLEKPSGSA